MGNMFEGLGTTLVIGVILYTAIVIGLTLLGVDISNHVHLQTHVRFN